MAEPKQKLWQVLEDVLLDQQISESLRGLDDPDYEVDQHDIDLRASYAEGVEALADWLFPYEDEPELGLSDIRNERTHAVWLWKQLMRRQLLEEIDGLKQ
jgi:hypothetical protein